MVSIIIPIYNMETYIHKMIQSVINQTYKDLEIILVNDGSTDQSGQICEDIYKKYQKSLNIKIIHKVNGGLSSARNAGIDASTGEYVIFPDPDDYVEPGYIETLMTMAKTNHSDLEICNFYTFNKRKEKIWTKNHSEVFDRHDGLINLMRSDFYCGYAWNKLFHSEIIKENNLRFNEDFKIIQDLPFCYNYIKLCDRISYTDVPLYHYNLSSGVSSNRSTLTKNKLTGIDAYNEIISKEKDQDVLKFVYFQLFRACIEYLFQYYNTADYNSTDDLKKIRSNMDKSKEYYLNSDECDILRKTLAIIALHNEKLYYYIKKIWRHKDIRSY